MAILSDEDARDLLGLDNNDELLPMIRQPVEELCKDYAGWGLERDTYTEYYPVTERGGGYMFFPGEFGSQDRTGGRTNVIQLRCKYVLASGLAVSEFAGAYMGQSDATDWDLLDLGDDYYLDLHDDNVSRSGHVKRLGDQWPKTRGSVRVVYTAGFTATELSGAMTGDADYTHASDIRYAVMLAVAAAYNEMAGQRRDSTRRVTGVITAEAVPDYSYRVDGAVARMLSGMASDLPLKAKQILDRYTNKYSLSI